VDHGAQEVWGACDRGVGGPGTSSVGRIAIGLPSPASTALSERDGAVVPSSRFESVELVAQIAFFRVGCGLRGQTKHPGAPSTPGSDRRCGRRSMRTDGV
jgi:hypothetical protein